MQTFNRKSQLLFLAILFFTNTLCSQNNIDAYLKEVLERYEVPGMAVAVIQKGEVVYQNCLGYADLDTKRAVNQQTYFDLHSLSKIFVATAIFQLIDQGKLNLNDPVEQYITDLPKSWHGRQLKHLLTFSSGFPEIVRYEANSEEEAKAKVYKDDPYYAPGDHFDYNQSNFWMLNRIIRAVTKKSLFEFIKEFQFGGLAKDITVTGQHANIHSQMAIEYFWNEAGERTVRDIIIPDHLHGAGGLILSLQSFIKWNQKLDEGKLLGKRIKKQMWSPFNYKKGNPGVYGWATYPINGRTSYGFTGGGIVGFRKFVDDDLSIILLTNGYKYSFDKNKVIHRIAGMLDTDLIDQMAINEENMYQAFNEKSIPEALKAYRDLKIQQGDMNFENTLNRLGYDFLNRKKYDVALAIFKLNVEEYPTAWNVYDSLAEAYEITGNSQKAIQFYKKSLELNADNGHAKERLEVLGNE